MSDSYLQRSFLILVACLLGVASFSLPAKSSEWRTEGRVIAISDIHGAYDDFLALLNGVHLIDAEGHWQGGSDHLVVVGDVLDRGAASRDVMNMIMQLESEAQQAGGMVHLLLGNHEVMNLVGDLRYVAVDEYARYADLEDSNDRSEGLQRFREHGKNSELGEVTLMEKFNKTHPPGFFAHRQMFSSNGRFGKWLLQRPAVLKVNDSVFVHGGLSESMMGSSIDKINALHRQVLADYLSAMEYFINNGVLEAATNFFDQPRLVNMVLEHRAAEGDVSTNDQAAAKKLFAAYRSGIFAEDSPTWYRGNVGCSPAIEKDRLRKVLESFGAKRLLVGHTPTSSRHIESRFDDMLIRVDTGMLKARYRGQASAAIIEGGEIRAYYTERPELNAIVMQQRQVEPRPGGLQDTQLEQVLVNGAISSNQAGTDRTMRLGIASEGQILETLFTPAKSTKRGVANLPAVAAYRLDRHLGLEMIPVTMLRNVDGEQGAISLDIDNLIDEDQRVARQLGGSAWCPLKDQFNMMYLFDSLVHNKGRAKSAMRYVTNDMRLILTENELTLGTSRSLPRYLRKAGISIPDDVKKQLQAINPAMLEEMLGDVLDEKRLQAILARRDQLLKTR